MYIPDPTELIEGMIETQISLVGEDGMYPCGICGVETHIDNIEPISDHPAAPGMCPTCVEYRNS